MAENYTEMFLQTKISKEEKIIKKTTGQFIINLIKKNND